MMSWCPDWGPTHVMGRDWVSEREEKEKGGNKRKEEERERERKTSVNGECSLSST